jgi:signal transduction histidine kinase
LDEKQVQALKHLTRQAAILLETRKKNKELQRLALSERELKEKAEAAREAQEQFLSTMSHEIRTPLNGVIGMVNILQSESPKPEQKEYLETLQFASKNLLCIVNDVLDYNKISAGHLLLEEVSFDLHLLLQDIRRSHLPNAMKKGIGLFLYLDEALPGTVKADPTRLTQVLNNLVGNAVKFTPEGKVDVVVKPVKVEGDAVTVSFSVQDTGIGFEEEKAASLFEQFSQAHVGITRKFGGTGLGLSITKKLLALMGSDIYATSTPGKGSSFSFELTLQTEPAGPTAKPADFPEPCQLQNKKVLIADDNAINILVTRKMLQRWEMSTEVAYNGKDALEKIQSGPYDLVLMDAQMPVMDGITTVKQMRARNLFSGPVILLTADAFINAKDEVRSWGFDDYLLKPFTADQLFGKICRLM